MVMGVKPKKLSFVLNTRGRRVLSVVAKAKRTRIRRNQLVPER
jgi:hypothetical protein